jgi:hypothetical protein
MFGRGEMVMREDGAGQGICCSMICHLLATWDLLCLSLLWCFYASIMAESTPYVFLHVYPFSGVFLFSLALIWKSFFDFKEDY